jgi:hypothetical protein
MEIKHITKRKKQFYLEQNCENVDRYCYFNWIHYIYLPKKVFIHFFNINYKNLTLLFESFNNVVF